MLHDDRYRLDDFELYQLAREFRKSTCLLIKHLPYDEKYALAPQMRRAVLSVTNNIAEGHGRWQWQKNTRFCRNAVVHLGKSLMTCTYAWMKVTAILNRSRGVKKRQRAWSAVSMATSRTCSGPIKVLHNST